MSGYWSRDVPGASSGAEPAPAQAQGSPSARLSLAVGRCLGTVLVTLRGELDAFSAPRLAGVLTDLLDGQGNLDIILELGGLRTVDPCALDVLAVTADNNARRGGRLRLSRPARDVLDALATAGLAGS